MNDAGNKAVLDELAMTRDIRKWPSFVAGAVMAAVVGGGPPADTVRAQEDSEKKALVQRISDSATAVSEIMSAGDKAIPRAVLEKAEAIAVFPRMPRPRIRRGQGPNTLRAVRTLGIRGRGILSVRGEQGAWSPPAFLSVLGGTFPPDADLVLVITKGRGLENVMRIEFKIDADAAVAAGPLNSDAQASTGAQPGAQIFSYLRSRGVLAGVPLNGSTLRQDAEANRRFYAKPLTAREAVGQADGPEPVAVWRAALKKHVR
jgi:lipid-binding SYLF domain-containing protein